MTVVYSAAFDVSGFRDGQTTVNNSFTLTLTSAGLGDIAITASDFDSLAGTYFFTHGYILDDTENHEGTAMLQEFSGGYTFATALNAIITAKMASVSPSWTGAINVAFANGVYVVSRTSGSFSFAMTWGESASRWLMGFAANSSTATSHTGTLTPLMYIQATVPARSMDVENDFELEGVSDMMVSDDGSTYHGVTRTSAPKMRSWFQQFEPTAAVHKASIAGTVRWTYEHLFEHCRSVLPFVCDDGVDVMACVFTPQGSAWRGKQRPGGAGDNVHMHIPFNVWHAGDVVIAE